MRPRLPPPITLPPRSLLRLRSLPPIRSPLFTIPSFLPGAKPPALPQPPPRQFSTTPSLPFLSSLLPTAPTTTLTATKTLPYPPLSIYKIISDINSYRHFLPHCTHSLVTSYTPSRTNPLPKTGDLTVGWGPFTQSYTSRVYCIPYSTVEAVAGNAVPTIPGDVLREYGYDPDELLYKDKGLEQGGVFESLTTKWTVKETKRGDGTEVGLTVTFRFVNPAVGLAVQSVADEMVGKMILAFEGRARELYGLPPT
ncbi:coenzyme Q-binding protein COQ10, mitochondrial [Triangularia verruculosa]|uniref:Coenzyme Q-binding protein COQ10, mitochondrial n=1 Tax=Triangularia verruculosa TaxID=2587418 RepID=A0AAN7AYL3_9PEZI|nr:coenzyme Q-binding protein COQ10, mitochondrial [Triangularia verruculosa]